MQPIKQVSPSKHPNTAWFKLSAFYPYGLTATFSLFDLIAIMLKGF